MSREFTADHRKTVEEHYKWNNTRVGTLSEALRALLADRDELAGLASRLDAALAKASDRITFNPECPYCREMVQRNKAINAALAIAQKLIESLEPDDIEIDHLARVVEALEGKP